MYTKLKNKSIIVLDILGISSASLCLVHCLLFPLFSIIPLGFSNNHWIDVFFACIGMFVVSKILLSHTSRLVKVILSISILTIITGVAIELIYETATPMVLIGGIGMIIGHLFNFKTHKHTLYEK
jgi:hypothetical protein